ncbi:ATPap18 pap18 [Chrysochromulina tobinii]|uniref:ATPap18 pap18 n=1 Tax=Chrysochromulina tobinii TaxID=1460289 RepID=A0A0M0K727_9EUKA|nr:ATPap18 pap18 [Chrysochromulina tobinii]|eukprot:KOO34193.1 ATPap18 pap18 [Chrysochromulina sp. CCMP291]
MVVSFATSNKPSYQATPICTLVAPDGSNVTFSGASHTYTTNVSSPWQGLLHTVRFTGLTPSQRYKYTCRVGSSEGAQHSFLAAPPVGYLPVTVAVVGDMGEGCNMDDHGRDGCANATIARLQADVAKASEETSASAEANNGTAPFSLLVHVGDIAYTGGVETVYDGFLNELEPVAASVPYQLNFISADLAAVNRTRTPWVVAFAHRPVYCSTNDHNDCDIGALWWAYRIVNEGALWWA